MPHDLASTYRSSVSAMAADARVRSRILAEVEKIRRAALAAPTCGAAIARGHASDSVGMGIRRFHNGLGMHGNRLCAGVAYRSRGVVNLEREGKLTTAVLRCEHVVPVSVLSGIVWDRFRHADLEELTGFLLTRTVVAAVTRKEDATLLGRRRAYATGQQPRAWKASHPEFIGDLDPLRPGIRPLLRYHDTDIELVFMPTGQPADLENLTLEEHAESIAGLGLFDLDSYLPTKLAA